MRKSKFTETQTVSILNEAEAGLAVKEVCRKHGISSACYYQWKAKYGGLGASELKGNKGHIWTLHKCQIYCPYPAPRRDT